MPELPNGPHWSAIIRDLGFPIVVALFLLYQIPQLSNALTKLSVTLDNVNMTLVQEISELRKHRDRTEGPFRSPRVEEEEDHNEPR